MEGMTKNEATHESEEMAQAQVDIWRFILGSAEIAAVRCAVDLGIPDILENHADPITLSQLSSALACSSAALFRIMRFLVNIGIFKEKITNQGSMGFVRTPMSRLLVKDEKNSLASMFLFVNSPITTAPWNFLSSRVLDDNASPFICAHGINAWQYEAKNLEYRKLIDEAMACHTRITVPEVLDGCGEVFNGLSSVVNVGGGNGAALGMIVKWCPQIHGINFDLPHVVSVAPECKGIEQVGGDMFMSVPKANAALLKYILHNWGDDECIKILRNCREAIAEYGTSGKVIILDVVIQENEEDKLNNVGLMLDLVMMILTEKGKERTAKEWSFILREAGFTTHTVKKINHSALSVIEAYP